MIKSIFFACIMLISLHSFSQSKEEPEIDVNLILSFESRFHAFFGGVRTFTIAQNHPIIFNLSNQLIGSAIKGGLELHHNKTGFGITYLKSFRYDHVYFAFKAIDTLQSAAHSAESVDKWLNDNTLILSKSFHLNREKDKKLTAGLGVSLLNCNSLFASGRLKGVIQGYPLVSYLNSDFRFRAYNLNISYQVKNIQLYFLGYYSFGMMHNYEAVETIFIPSIGLTYKIPFKKIIKELR